MAVVPLPAAAPAGFPEGSNDHKPCPCYHCMGEDASPLQEGNQLDGRQELPELPEHTEMYIALVT